MDRRTFNKLASFAAIAALTDNAEMSVAQAAAAAALGGGGNLNSAYSAMASVPRCTRRVRSSPDNGHSLPAFDTNRA